MTWTNDWKNTRRKRAAVVGRGKAFQKQLLRDIEARKAASVIRYGDEVPDTRPKVTVHRHAGEGKDVDQG